MSTTQDGAKHRVRVGLAVLAAVIVVLVGIGIINAATGDDHSDCKRLADTADSSSNSPGEAAKKLEEAARCYDR